MSDTVCVMCGETWDVYHINEDAPFHVRELFRAGKGCESCRGVPPAKEPDIDNVCSVLLNGGDEDDPIDMIHAIGDGVTVKDWSTEWDLAEGKEYVLATCEGCDRKASFDAEDVYGVYSNGVRVPALIVTSDAVIRQGGRGTRERSRVPIADFKDGTATAFGQKIDLTLFDNDWEFQVVHGKTVCSDCCQVCEGDECEEVVFTGAAHSKFVGDTYDPGSSFYSQEMNKTFCTSCFELLPYCNHCGTNCEPRDETEFIDDDDGRCEHCTSFTKCSTCDTWRPGDTGDLVRFFMNDSGDPDPPSCMECFEALEEALGEEPED